MARRSLLGKINIPASNIHRIRGESDPAEEASRYSLEIIEYTRQRDLLPVFDLIILGLGEDGHTASIFPSNMDLIDSFRICELASHPVTGQKRITLTGRLINNAEKVTFLTTGKKKAGIVEKILNKSYAAQNFPASMIVPVYGELEWFLDKDAASLL
jgi:6-phosphogluconolactonase